MPKRAAGAVAALSVLVFCLAPAVDARQAARPPEYAEIMAAQRIVEAEARLKEFERIKAAYPRSGMTEFIDTAIRVTRIEMSATLDEVLALQKPDVGLGEGFEKLISYLNATSQISSHPRLASFDKPAVVKAILDYRERAVALLQDEAYVNSIPTDEQPYLVEYGAFFRVDEAIAWLNAGDPVKALAALDAYKAEGGLPEARPAFTAAEAYARMGKDEEALAGYLDAAVENYRGSLDRAREMWIKIKGSADGFDAVFESRLKELPFHPEPFTAPSGWKGRTVLAEIFTGSECPPCVGADLGFDGLIESIPETHLAVLEYHLPIPRPDPLINPATQFRAQYYGVRGTPSTYFDGEAKAGGGSGRMGSVLKYKEYLKEIMARLSVPPEVKLTPSIARDGDRLIVDVAAEKTFEEAEIVIVLAEKEVAFKGGNGIAFHKMVVRDMKAVAFDAPRAVFDLAASEKTTDEYMTAFEKNYTRIPGYTFSVRYNTIGRDDLKVVVIVQDKETKKVLNAASADVK